MVMLHRDAFEVQADASSLMLAANLILATCFSYRSMKPPNPPPGRNETVTDFLGGAFASSLLVVARSIFPLLGLLQSIFTIMRPISPSAICPHPQHLSPTKFQWSTMTIASICFQIIGGSIRLGAYRQLGKNFTFQLAKPSGLVTGGLYRYVQHPSYLGLLFAMAGILSGPIDPGAGMGCFAPKSIANQLSPVFASYAAIQSASFFVALVHRIKREEDMLRKAFGLEWEAYHRATSRLIPGLY